MSDTFYELGALGIYLVILLWIGLRAGRQVQTSIDYTLAGRNVPWMIVLATTAATMVGGGASVGMVSQVYVTGVAFAVITCAWHLQLIFTGLFVAPKLRRLNLITVGDYFHVKFGPVARELAVINCIIFLVGALAAQMVAMGTVANTVLDIQYEWALLIGATVTIFYSTIGGIRAVVKTDVLQFLILVVGFGTAAVILLVRHGGFAEMAEKAQPGQFALTGHLSGMKLISLFFAFLLGETLIPPYTVRCFIARSATQARWGVAGSGLFLLLFLPVVTLILGTAAQIEPQVAAAVKQEEQDILATAEKVESSLFEGQSQKAAQKEAAQIAFPTLLRTVFPPVFSGVMIAAIMAAVMSSADSCLSCLATVAMEDYYRRHLNPQASDRQLLRVARQTTLWAGVAAAGCAFYYRSVADLLVFVYDFWAPAMVLPFLVAVFWYHPSRIYATVTSMFAGMTAAVVWRLSDSPYELGPALFGFIVAALTFIIVLPLTCHLPLQRFFQPANETIH